MCKDLSPFRSVPLHMYSAKTPEIPCYYWAFRIKLCVQQALNSCGAVSAPKTTKNFPGNTCISINREIAHGIPGNRKIQPGDLINIDVSAERGGYFADAGHSFQMPPYNSSLTRLCNYTHNTMMKVISSLKHGVKLNEIGRIIQTEAEKGGYKVI